MPIALPPRRPRPKPGRESFLLKSMLVVSALFLVAFLVVTAEFDLARQTRTLTEAEVAAQLAR
jgi:hypothetical protein